MDGGSSESITDDFSDLESYWEMDSIQINGVTSNVKVEHTYKGIYRMTTRSDKAMLILTHYLPQSSHLIICPNDTVESNNAFRCWNQHVHLNTGSGYIRFSTLGLTT